MKTIIHTPTPDLEQSIDFYRRLQFQQIAHPDQTYFSDGQCIIYINPDRFARAGLQLFRESWEDVVETLQQKTAVTTTESGYLLATPSGTRVYLNRNAPELEVKLSDIPPSHLGKFAGLSLETTDMQVSIALWEILGFQPAMGSAEQGWIGLQNKEGFGVSLMSPNSCPHLFFNPSLTYFNGGQNLAVIKKVREAGIPITEEITHFNKEGMVDNIIIRDPGGYGFFVFND